MRRIHLIAALLVMPLAACGGATTPVRSASAPIPPTRVKGMPATLPVRTPLPKPTVLAAPGLEGVIGATGADLTRLFGAPRLDVLEGDARKLQYSGNACVLDVYLYPPSAGREPQATYVDARRTSDGKDVDRAACVAALRKR